MVSMKSFISFTALLLACSPILPADTAKPEKKHEVWELPDHEYFLEHYPKPPETGSPMDQADLAYTLAVQTDATPEAIAEANIMAGFTVFTYRDVLGPDFSAEHYPETDKFFKKLKHTVNPPKNFLKDTYHRLRPCDAHPELVKQLVPYEEGFSNPSGHSTRSWAFALVLGELDPEHKEAFLRRAAAVGHSRILGGMHYQSDVIMSRGLAQEMFNLLMKNEQFKADLEALKKAEWTPAPTLPPTEKAAAEQPK